MLKDTRIGLPMIGSKFWYAGVTVIDSIINSIEQMPRNERPQLFFVMTDENLEYLSKYELMPLHEHLIPLTDGIIFFGEKIASAQESIKYPLVHCASTDELFKNIDLLLPVNSDMYPGQPAIPWIPDFQHYYLPHFFSAEDHQKRNTIFQNIAAKAPMVIFTSNDAKKDFLQLFPSSSANTKVLPIPVHPKEEWYTGDPYYTQVKYNLPDNFILCSNQFWMHKNHPVLFKALAILRASGQNVHLVCTGSTYDYRNPNYFNELQQYIHQLNITDLVHIVGLIPRHEQIQLMRRSLFVVHPSLFEGLNLIAQECQLLGKDIILSDLPIHQEQNFGIYFNRTDSVDLAQKISSLLPTSSPGPNLSKEADAQTSYEAKINEFIYQLSELVEDAERIFRSSAPPPTVVHTPHKSDQITIVTSLAVTKDLTIQKSAINSWIHCGFKVVSMNAQDEMNILKPQFPNIEFILAKRDARGQYGKPYVYIDDILSYFTTQNCRVCGIVNSDIHFFKGNLSSFMQKQAQNSLVFGSRLDIESFDKISNGKFYNGFDYFFFDRDFIKYYPPREFCIGLPWWDYWLPLIAILAKLPVKKVTNPICYHIIHPTNYSLPTWRELAGVIIKHFSLQAQQNDYYLEKLSSYILDKIENSSIRIELQ
jgi:glycosyltransferase involved in cell wall biosynthesis